MLVNGSGLDEGIATCGLADVRVSVYSCKALAERDIPSKCG